MSIFPTNIGVQGFPNIMGIPMNYTGKNINSTAASRTANTTPLLVGDVLTLDPFGQDTGVNSDLANPTTGFLHHPVYVVTQVPPANTLGGRIFAVPLALCAQGIGAFCKVNATIGTTCLGVTNDTDGTANLRHLVVYSTDPTTGPTLANYKAMPCKTLDPTKTDGTLLSDDTSTTRGIRTVVPI
jgi:hypothetical protein